MIRIAIVAACLMLASCAAAPAVDQGVSVVTSKVAVPYAVPCIVNKRLPDLPKRTPIDAERAATEQLAAAYAADVEVFEEYAKAADEILRACVKSIVKGDTGATTQPLRK